MRKETNWELTILIATLVLLVVSNLMRIKYVTPMQEQIHQLELDKTRLETEIEFLKKELEVPEPISYDATGQASWYGEADDECVGCREDRLMANGERYNEDAMTLAYWNVPLNSEVQVTNLDNGKTIKAKVTDTGGFQAEYGRVADLSKGLKNALGCTDLCQVGIKHE